MPWVHWFADRKGILKDWNIRFFPTMYILDHKGVIRAKGLRGEELEKKSMNLLLRQKKQSKAVYNSIEVNHECILLIGKMHSLFNSYASFAFL